MQSTNGRADAPQDQSANGSNSGSTSNSNQERQPQHFKIAPGLGDHFNDLPSGGQTGSHDSADNASGETEQGGKPNQGPMQSSAQRQAAPQSGGTSQDNAPDVEPQSGNVSRSTDAAGGPQTAGHAQVGTKNNQAGSNGNERYAKSSNNSDNHGLHNANDSGGGIWPAKDTGRSTQSGEPRARALGTVDLGEATGKTGGKYKMLHSTPGRVRPGHDNAGQGAQNGGEGVGALHEAYVGRVYSGNSPVNSIGKQPAAADPGSDPGTAVHALHLPKSNGDTDHALPGPPAASQQTPPNPLNMQERRSFSVVPVDLGSMSMFGTVPWGTPAPSNQKDPDVGKDGMGLLGSYYVGSDFDRLVFQRPDSNINYIWTGKGPGPKMPPRQPFTVRWTGKLVSTYTEPYTIMTASDDGVRVYLNGNLIIDNWTVHAVTEDTATVDLVANQPNDITVEYFEKNGMSNEIIKLYWESRRQPLEYIPETSLLYPQTN